MTSTGKAVTNLRIAVSSRRKNRDGEYADTPPVFYDVTVWGPVAENVAAHRSDHRSGRPLRRTARPRQGSTTWSWLNLRVAVH
jgi:hypothetical protein